MAGCDQIYAHNKAVCSLPLWRDALSQELYLFMHVSFFSVCRSIWTIFVTDDRRSVMGIILGFILIQACVLFSISSLFLMIKLPNSSNIVILQTAGFIVVTAKDMSQPAFNTICPMSIYFTIKIRNTSITYRYHLISLLFTLLHLQILHFLQIQGLWNL